MDRPLVAVVTLNWNGSAFLQDCIDSILHSDYERFKIIVVDNSSSDDSLSLLDDLYGLNPEVVIIQNPENLGYSKGMNVGLNYGFTDLHADYCLVMNNDTILDTNAITALVKVAETNNEVAFVTGKVFYYNKPDVFQTVGKKAHPVLINGGHIGRGENDHGQFDRDVELPFCDDIFWLVSRPVFAQTGGYDPEFFLQCEDFDWQLRAKKVGYKIYYAHKAKLWHRESMTIGKTSPRKAYYDTRNPLIAVMKNCAPNVVRKYMGMKVNQIIIPAMIKTAVKGKICISMAMLRGLGSAVIWKLRNH